VNRWKRWLPGLQILREYQAAWFARSDGWAVLTTMLVPVDIAYALASGDREKRIASDNKVEACIYVITASNGT